MHVHWSALGPAERGPREERPSEARILDALDTLAVRHVAERGPGPFALAAAVLMFEGVDELRRERGFIAAPAEDLPPIPRQIGYRVFTDLEAAVIAQPMMPWAHDLSVQVRARELAAVPKPSAGPRWPARRPRTFQAMMAERLGAGAIDALLPRVAVALRDAEAQAIVDLRRAATAGAEPEEELEQLAAVARTRRSLYLDRAMLHECVLARVPAC
ncbi:MAG: hypothetical protein IPL61_12630 [Myxococcales bacterium]|nr:hypothetical protein [Myxococcales bacterium]